MIEHVEGSGTAEDPWILTTPPGSSEFDAWHDEEKDTLAVRVGSTTLSYQWRCIDDLHAMLVEHGDWMPLGNADEQKEAKPGTVESWARAEDNPVRRLVRAAQGATGDASRRTCRPCWNTSGSSSSSTSLATTGCVLCPGSLPRVDDFRIEHDSMGEVQGPRRRAVAGPDPAGGRELPDQRHAARAATGARARPGQAGGGRAANGELGVLDRRAADAIEDAAASVAAGEHGDHFPVDVFQTGSGTSSNMNMNEVLASLAGRAGVASPQRPRQRQPVEQRHVPDRHPRRRGARRRRGPAARARRRSATASRAKAEEFADVVKSGRTHLMDATPVMLGQEFGGYAATLALAARAARRRPAPGARAAARRHRRRHRHQHPRGLRRRGRSRCSAS